MLLWNMCLFSQQFLKLGFQDISGNVGIRTSENRLLKIRIRILTKLSKSIFEELWKLTKGEFFQENQWLDLSKNSKLHSHSESQQSHHHGENLLSKSHWRGQNQCAASPKPYFQKMLCQFPGQHTCKAVFIWPDLELNQSKQLFPWGCLQAFNMAVAWDKDNSWSKQDYQNCKRKSWELDWEVHSGLCKDVIYFWESTNHLNLQGCEHSKAIGPWASQQCALVLSSHFWLTLRFCISRK